MPAKRPETLREQQLQFANHLRNPSVFAAPADIEERRMRIYRDLFFGNINNLLATTFPVIRSIFPDDKWQGLVRDFYAMHRSETPLFPYVAGEFAEYLLNERGVDPAYPFLGELAWYEWSEIALRHGNEWSPDLAESRDIGNAKPALSPSCWPMVFRFPVHRIGVGCLPQQAPSEATHLLVYRSLEGQVKFIESSAATFRLLQLLDDDSLPTMQAVIESLAIEMQCADIQELQEMVDGTIRQFLASHILFSMH